MKLQKILQFDMDGNFLNEYPMMVTASKATGVKASSISRCCNNIRKSAGGFIWRFDKDDKRSRQIGHKNKDKAILQYDLSGNLIARHPSVQAAIDHNPTCSIAGMISALKGQQLTSGRFLWIYDDAFAEFRYKRAMRKIEEARRKVVCYNVLKQRIATYPSVHEASRRTGLPNGNLSACCRNPGRMSGDFLWFFLDDQESIDAFLSGKLIAGCYAKIKKITCVDLQGKQKEYRSIKAAAIDLDLDPLLIQNTIDGNKPAVTGYTFSYNPRKEAD